MQAKYHYIFMLIVLAAVFLFCLRRDVQIEREGPRDLRNRIVGARLQMDGKPPYFYKWQAKDGIRYYDPIKVDTTYANAITASPFFHHLLFPIANLPQRQIAAIWLGVQYILFFLCILLAYSFTKEISQKWAVTITGALFLFTEAWITLIFCGQIYIVYPFMAFLFLYFFQRNDNFLLSFFGGLSAVALFLMRPTTALFFLPFLFLLKRYSIKCMLVFFLPVIFFLSYSLLDKTERSFWLDYRKAIAAQVKDHQSEDRMARTIAFKPIIYKNWEGWEQDSIEKAIQARPLNLELENAGVQDLMKYLFKIKILSEALSIFSIIIILLLTATFFIRRIQNGDPQIIATAIFGFCLYMISDFFSPVLRIQYYGVQWLFPLLLLAAFFSPKLKAEYFLLFTGLILNISDNVHLRRPHTIGEYLILFTLLWLCLCPGKYYSRIKGIWQDKSLDKL